MKRSSLPLAGLLLASILLPAGAAPPEKELHDFYPEIEPFKTGYLKVSDLHQIYYELCGNPDGRPVMVLHGGPGGGSYPQLRRYHDPQKYLIVLHDQRGSGRSKPYTELRENNTVNLVQDIERLRQHLELPQVQIFGGSWGSTLGLAYAETFPQSVSSLVIRGVFTATKEEIDHFYHGPAGKYFPQTFARLQSILPHPETLNYPQQLFDLLRHKDPEVRRQTALAWAGYECKIAFLEITDEQVAASLKEWEPYDFALLENYYMANNCFLEEGQLLRQAHKIKSTPTVIIQGRYDLLCPPLTAYRLHQALPESKLVIVEAAGHTGSTPRNRSAVIKAIESLEH